MKIEKDKGIVLSSRLINEADLLCIIFTRNHGKRTFIFKGLKKSKKRDISASEPGTFLEIIYYFKENKDLYIIKDFKVKNANLDLRENLDKIYSLYVMIETVEKTSGINDCNPPLFSLLSSGIDMLANSERPVNLLIFFIIHLIKLHGILPDLFKCDRCGTREFSDFQLDINDLTLTCSKCNTFYGKTLQIGSRRILQQSQNKKFNSLPNDIISTEEAHDLLFILTLFLEHYFNIQIKSKSVLLNS